MLRIFIVRFREIWVRTLHRSTRARNLLLHRCTHTTLHPQMQQQMHLRPHQPEFIDAFQSSCVRQMAAIIPRLYLLSPERPSPSMRPPAVQCELVAAAKLGGFGGFHIPGGHSKFTCETFTISLRECAQVSMPSYTVPLQVSLHLQVHPFLRAPHTFNLKGGSHVQPDALHQSVQPRTSHGKLINSWTPLLIIADSLHGVLL